MSLYIDSELQSYCTLVLCIEERGQEDYDDIDARIFIFWDCLTERYMLFGRRQNRGSFTGIPYAFSFDNSKDLCDFVYLTFEDRPASVTYYNFNNLYDLHKYNLNGNSYEFFENNMDKNYEVVGYDHSPLEYRSLRKEIKLLKNAMSVLENCTN